jgi:hypothetical protein
MLQIANMLFFIILHYMSHSNEEVEPLTLKLPLPQFPASNFGPQTGHMISGVSWLSSVYSGKFRKSA